MKNPAISVIIPMFNAERFIGECLQSLANQTFQDFEIIIVDDCSTDNSINAATSFNKFFGERLRIAKLNKNSGYASVPRNFALEAASGKYVCFIDNDDFLAETALEELYIVAENFNADVVHTEKYIIVTNENGQFKFTPDSYQTGEFVTEPTLETFDIGERMTGFTQGRFLWNIWSKLFRRQFLIDNKINSPELRLYEDYIFVIKCLVAAKNYVRVPFVDYFCRLRKNSPSHKGMDNLAASDIMCAVVKALDDFTNTNKFFADNPQYKFMLIDFFMQEQLRQASAALLYDGCNIGELYDFMREKAFSRRPQDNIALTAYLFTTCLNLKLEVEN